MKKYLVGGAVRDSLLHLPIKEKDWLVVGTTPQEMLKKGYQQVGKDFPVFLHPKNREEYSLARTEYKFGKGYVGFKCRTTKITLEEDLYRRDLTINAIAIDMQGNIIDPYHGQRDIKQRILRHVSNSFIEDPLRVLRVARFAARFAYLNFNIASETMILMKNMINELTWLSPERIWKETEKALETKDPQVYFQILHECGALKLLLPEINILFGVKIQDTWHKNIDIGMHTLMTLLTASRLSQNIGIRFAALCHDVGKNIKFNNSKLENNFDNNLGEKLVRMICYRLKVPNLFRDLAIIIVKYSHLLYSIKNFTPTTLVKFFYKIDIWRKPERLEYIIILGKAEAWSRPGFEHMPYPQEEFLRQAYKIAHSININHLIKLGLSGIQIGKKLYLKRTIALTYWQEHYKIIQ